MKRAWLRHIAAGLAAMLLLSGCSNTAAPGPTTRRVTRTTVLEPRAPGEVVLGNSFAGVDASCTGDGYIQLHYSGTAVKAKLQLTLPDGNMYTYTLAPGKTETIPLTGGSGETRYYTSGDAAAFSAAASALLGQEIQAEHLPPMEI